MTTVRALPGVELPTVDPKLLEEITTLYDLAAKGQLSFFAVTYLTEGGEVKCTYAGEVSPFEALGMVEDLKLTIREEMFE